MIRPRRRPRRGKATPAQKAKVRQQVYDRASGLCELKVRPDCIAGKLPFKGSTPFDHGHLVHKKSEGSGGKTDLENCCWGCWRCHLIGLHVEGGQGKIVPAKAPEQMASKDWTIGYYGN